ncbi:MAG: cyclic nucleotide-binding domain-containing protein [Opitutaceae bacterium]|nr:cyclic nucleotide-binding domain-containing protein [Opitutaceae bacterium]
MSPQRISEGEFRPQLGIDLLHALAGVLAGLWLPLVIVGHDLARDPRHAVVVDLFMFLVAGASAALGWKRPLGWRHWLRVGRDIAVALPLWTLFNEHATGSGLWALKFLAVLYVLKLSTLSSRTEALPPAAGRLLGLVIILPLMVWWSATGWLVLGGDVETGDARLRLVRAVYWAITTMATVGYGDIVPKTIPQMFYACSIMVTGVAAFGYILSNIATLMLRFDAARQHQEALLDRVEFFMKYYTVPPGLRQRVRQYFKFLWTSRHGYNDAEVFDSLPRSLRAELSMYLHRDLLAKVPLLHDASQELLRDLVVALRPVVYLPGDFVCRMGAAGDEMYFILRGEIEVLDGNEVPLARLHEGDYFGETALLTNQARNASARADSFCDLYVLDRETFTRVVKSHPDFHAALHQKAHARPSMPVGAPAPVPRRAG